MHPVVIALALVFIGCHHGPVRHPNDFEDDDRPRHHHGDDHDEDEGIDEDEPEPPRHLPVAILQAEPALGVAEVAPGPPPRVVEPAGPGSGPAPTVSPWPLTELPTAQPHLDAGLPCKPRPGQHADVRAYLDAWCRLRAGDRTAESALAALARSARADVMRAARIDLIDRIANESEAHLAIARLNALQLDQAQLLELLASTYMALRKPGQALAVAEALLPVLVKSSPREACELMLAWGDIDTVLPHADELTDDVCGPRAAALACALRVGFHHKAGDLGSPLVGMRECFRALPDDPDRDRKLELILVHTGWETRRPARWIELARHGEIAIGLPSGEAHAVTALIDAILASDCTADVIDEVRAAATRIAALPAHDPSFDPQLAELAAMTVPACAALHP